MAEYLTLLVIAWPLLGMLAALAVGRAVRAMGDDYDRE